jgi:hypothetical protein
MMNQRKTVMICFLYLTLAFVMITGIAFAAPERGKGISRESLPGELKAITIARDFIHSHEKKVANIEIAEGGVIVSRPKAKQTYFAAAGDPLFENDVVYTLKKSRCKFKLTTEDTVTIGQQSKVSIKQVVDDRTNNTKSSVFSMARGTAIFYVARVFRYSSQSLQVETPTAVSGVRGSKFGVEIKRSGAKQVSTEPLLLADASGDHSLYLASIPKDNTVTLVHDLEGIVEVRSKKDDSVQKLHPGQSIEATIAGLGRIFETPAKMLEQFMNDVEVGYQKMGKKIEKSADKAMEKPIGALDKLGRDLEKKFGK